MTRAHGEVSSVGLEAPTTRTAEIRIAPCAHTFTGDAAPYRPGLPLSRGRATLHSRVRELVVNHAPHAHLVVVPKRGCRRVPGLLDTRDYSA